MIVVSVLADIVFIGGKVPIVVAWDIIGDVTDAFAFVGVTLGGGVGTDTEGVGGLDVVAGGGGVFFFIGAAVANAVGLDGWAGIEVWLDIAIPWGPVTAVVPPIACWLPPNYKFI